MDDVRSRRGSALVVAVASMFLLGAACSDDGEGGDARTSADAATGGEDRSAGESDRSPEETVASYAEATIEGDCDRIEDLVTESFWTERGALTSAEAADDCREDLERDLVSPQDVTVDDVELVDENGSEAIVVVSGTDGSQDWSTEMTVVRDGGEWRVHFTEPQ